MSTDAYRYLAVHFLEKVNPTPNLNSRENAILIITSKLPFLNVTNENLELTYSLKNNKNNNKNKIPKQKITWGPAEHINMYYFHSS